MTKIIVIGANHAGTTASNTLLDHIKDVDLTIYDRNNNISFLGCGMVLDMAAKYGIDVEYTDFEDLQKPAFMENVENAKVKVRIVYRKDDRRIVGAQLGSTYDISMGIHMFSLAIQKNVTIDELALTDIFFMPHFNQPYNYITMAAVSAVLG